VRVLRKKDQDLAKDREKDQEMDLKKLTLSSFSMNMLVTMIKWTMTNSLNSEQKFTLTLIKGLSMITSLPKLDRTIN